MLLAALLMAAPAPAWAVTFLEQIERLRLVYSLLLDYRPGQAPLPADGGGPELALELIPQPEVDHRVGAKDEPIDPPAAIPRARLRWRSSGGWLLGVTASPSLELGGYKATWLGGELGLGGRVAGLNTELRLYAIAGEVQGPLTASSARDTFAFRNSGADVRAGLPLGALHLYAGLGSGSAHSALEIASDGGRDSGDADYTYALGGATWSLGALRLTLEQHATADALRHVILAAGLRW